MLQEEIDRIRLTIEEAMVDAPASAMLFRTGRVSLDELMQFLELLFHFLSNHDFIVMSRNSLCSIIQ